MREFAVTIKPGESIRTALDAIQRPVVDDNREYDSRCPMCREYPCRCAELDAAYEQEAYPWR